MAKFQLKFHDYKEEESKTAVVFMNEKENTDYENDYIRMYFEDNNKRIEFYFDMDKSTAIKFAKTLRTEINKITEREDQNGK
jgi:adenosine deaminase